MVNKLNREKHCNSWWIDVFKNFAIGILKTFWFRYRLECKFIEGLAENQLSFINSD